MAKAEIEIPQSLLDEFINHLYEDYGELEAIAYQQLRLQKQAGSMARSLIGHMMRSTFSVPEVPEEFYHED